MTRVFILRFDQHDDQAIEANLAKMYDEMLTDGFVTCNQLMHEHFVIFVWVPRDPSRFKGPDITITRFAN